MTDAPRISDAEATAVYKRLLLADDEQDLKPHPATLEHVRESLAAFLAKRVPDAKPVDFHKPGMGPLLSGGEWNACRDAVLKGRE